LIDTEILKYFTAAYYSTIQSRLALNKENLTIK